MDIHVQINVKPSKKGRKMHSYSQHENKFLFCLILTVHILAVLGCGNNEDVKNNSKNGFGFYAAILIFPPDIPRLDSTTQSTTKAVEGGIDCDAANIATINCELFSADNNLIAEEIWPCNQGEGFVKNIPPGSGITVVVTAKDERGVGILRGEDRNVTIIANRQTEGEIKMTPADSPMVVAGSEPKTLVFDWSHIVFPDGVDHYQLQVDPDGDSSFSTVENADDIQSTEFTVTIPVHFTDWGRAIYRVVALDTSNNVVATSGEVDLLTTIPSADVIGYFKASNTDAGDHFGAGVAISADGNTLAVMAQSEASAAMGVNGNEADNSAYGAGAVYVFIRRGVTWQQQAYVKASNTDEEDLFGSAVALSADGNTLAVGAWGEASAAQGINGDDTDNSMDDSGAVYIFTRGDETWQQQAYVKASNTDTGDRFGNDVSLSADGSTLAVGAWFEGSASRGIGGDEIDNSMGGAGAVYVFTRSGVSWQQQAYIKASNTDAMDYFGTDIALSAGGGTLAVGAIGESSAAFGIGSDETDNSMDGAGAVYFFMRDDETWQQLAYIKASNTDAGDRFGSNVALDTGGFTLAVAANQEDSAAIGINGDDTDNSMDDAGAVYVFTRRGASWEQQAYVKASNTDAGDFFGWDVTLTDNGNTIAVGAWFEDSSARGINGNDTDNSIEDAGAVYIFTRSGMTFQQQAYIKASNTDTGNSFGSSVTLSANSDTLAVGSGGEASATRGINGDQTDNSAPGAGAVYLY
jgi:hypothetical protein